MKVKMIGNYVRNNMAIRFGAVQFGSLAGVSFTNRLLAIRGPSCDLNEAFIRST